MSNWKKVAMGAAGAAAAGGGGGNIENIFNAWVYDGNSTTQKITNNIDLSTDGGLVITKKLDGIGAPSWYDTARGTGSRLASDSTNQADSISGHINSFNTDGFTLGSSGIPNGSNDEYIAYTFKKTPNFFDVQTASIPDPEPSTITVSHDLGTTVGMAIIKATTHTYPWVIFHTSMSSGKYLQFDTQGQQNYGGTNWSSTNSTVTLPGWVGQAGGDVVIYLFANNNNTGNFGPNQDQDIVSCGLLSASTSGYINLGWEPYFLMIKRLDATGDWQVFDRTRRFGLGGSTDDQRFYMNTSGSQGNVNSSYLYPVEDSLYYNTNFFGGGPYIYLAIRGFDMAEPTSASEVFQAKEYTGNGSTYRKISTDIRPDLFIHKDRFNNYGQDWDVHDRKRGAGNRYRTNEVSANANDGDKIDRLAIDHWRVGGTNEYNNGSSYHINHMWKMAPKFFDIATYQGDGGSPQTVSHDLGVAPEMMWIRSNQYQSMLVWNEIDDYLHMNIDASNARGYSSNIIRSTYTVDSTSFQIGPPYTDSGNYTAYLFATLSGISKVGKYTGNGSTQTINCGFTNGSRYVLIKRTDSDGHWAVFDTARGINSGDDRLLRYNLTNADTAGQYINYAASGFSLATSNATVNANNGSYLFYAIAT